MGYGLQHLDRTTLARVVDSLPVGLAVVDRGGLRYLNRSGASLCGVAVTGDTPAW